MNGGRSEQLEGMRHVGSEILVRVGGDHAKEGAVCFRQRA